MRYILFLLLLTACTADVEVATQPSIEPQIPTEPSMDPVDPSIPQMDPVDSNIPQMDAQMEMDLPEVGPYTHKVVFGQSTLVEHASVPDALVLHTDVGEFKAGTWMIVYVYMPSASAEEQIGMMYSTNEGQTWSEHTVVPITGQDHVPVDPALFQLDDGTLLLYYFDFLANRLYPGMPGERSMHVASSTDGLVYTYSQNVYTRQTSMTDPDVILYDDTYYLYFATDDGVYVAQGSTPYMFENEMATGMTGIPGTLIDNGQLYLFGCGSANGVNGITRSIGSNAYTFSGTTVLGPGCDPAPVTVDEYVFKEFMNVGQP